MPAPPSHSGVVTLADFSRRGEAPCVLRVPPVTVEAGWNQPLRSRVAYKVDARDVYAFTQFAIGLPYTVTVGMGTAVRVIPLSHPDLPQLICKGVGAVLTGGFTFPDDVAGSTGRTATLANWSHARVELLFESVPYLVDGSTPFMTINQDGAGQEYSLAGKKLTFPSDGKRVDADATVSVPVVVYRYTIYQCFALDDNVINPYLANPVSSATVGNCAAGSLRLDSYSSQATVTQGGSQTYTRTLSLAYRPIDWNQVLRPEGTWEAPTKPGGGYIYGTSDLNGLFV